jgi:hypothetical protein
VAILADPFGTHQLSFYLLLNHDVISLQNSVDVVVRAGAVTMRTKCLSTPNQSDVAPVIALPTNSITADRSAIEPPTSP